MTPEQYIFYQGSQTYYNATILFPRKVREDVILLYSFVRTADNYVDATPQHTNEFRNLMATWQDCRGRKMYELQPEKDDKLNLRVTKNISRLMHEYKFDPRWIDAFLYSMEMDTGQKKYYSLEDSLRYVYGSAEVIGLMMAKIMGLPEASMEAAAAQGRAMQWMNFIRDIAEDIELRRQYFPSNELKEYGLSDLHEKTAKENRQAFKDFISLQLKRYQQWQQEADKGMEMIPKRYRLPVQVAADSYRWTAKQIEKDPFIVYRHKVKPGKVRIFSSAFAHLFD